MRIHRMLALAVVVAAIVSGCRTTKDVLNDYEANLKAGAYLQATGEVTEYAQKSGGDQLLWALLSGGAWHLADNKNNAIAQFDLAEDIFSANDKASVFVKGGEGTMAMLTNDKAFSYDGGGEDRVFTCLYKAIDYATQGDVAAARTEFNRAAQHQENWIWERRKDIQAAEERLEKEAAAKEKADKADGAKRAERVSAVMNDRDFSHQFVEKCRFNPFVSGDLDKLTTKDYVNAYVQHVTGVFRWINKDGGERDMFRDAAGLTPNSAVARDLADVEKGARPVDQVWIYAEDGLCSCREEWRVDLPLLLLPGVNRYVLYAGMAFPYLHERSAGAQNWTVSAGGTTLPLEPLADVDKLVKTEYDVYMRGAFKREITRTLVKVGTQIACGVVADNVNDWRTQTAMRASQVAAAVWAASTTAADLRSWTTLPKNVFLQRVTRPADGKIQVMADAQPIDITVPPGNTMVFLHKPGPLAKPAIKLVTFRK